MPSTPNPTSSEPLLIVGLVSALTTAAMTLLVQFGIDLTAGQQAAVVGAIAALGALVTALWGRSKVYSPATVAGLLASHGAATVTAEADNTMVTTSDADVRDPQPRLFAPGRAPVNGGRHREEP